jgi:hypothetical protein
MTTKGHPSNGVRPGERRGGRKPGSKNKRTAYELAKAEFEGSPLDFMLNVMKDKKAPTAFRFQAAKECAPYLHAKLASVTVKGDPKAPLHQTHTDLTPEELRQVATDVLGKV